MSSRSGRSQQIKHKYGKIYALTALLCAVVAVIVTITALQLSGVTTILPAKTAEKTEAKTSPAETSPDAETTATAPTTGDKPSGGVNYVECKRYLLTAYNPLLTVDEAHPFEPQNADDLVIIKTAPTPEDGANPAVYTWFNMLNGDALKAFQKIQKQMLDRYDKDGSIFVNISYTEALSNKQSDIELGLVAAKCSDKNCENCAYSDHATGYALDIRYNDGHELTDGVKREQTEYFLSLCPQYGFVQSWVQNGVLTPGKTAKDTWHFRYVGVPHAQYMTQNGLTFEGYMDALRATNYNKRLWIKTEDGTHYEMYFVKAAEDVTRVPVPSNVNYTIAGNGNDGFIVTIKGGAGE